MKTITSPSTTETSTFNPADYRGISREDHEKTLHQREYDRGYEAFLASLVKVPYGSCEHPWE
jgi:hypothetical protein